MDESTPGRYARRHTSCACRTCEGTGARLKRQENLTSTSERRSEKVRGQLLAAGIDAVAQLRPDVPLDPEAGGSERFACQVQGLDWNEIVGFTVHEQNGRAGLDLAQTVGPRQQPRVGNHGRGRNRPAQTHVQGEHAALAETNERQAFRGDAEACKLLRDKAIEPRRCGNDPAPILARIAQRQGKPLQRAQHSRNRLRRVRGYEGSPR